MAINIGDAVVKLVGDSTQLNQSLDQANSRVQQSMQRMQGALRMGGMAMTALGAGGLKLIDSARKMNAELGQTAITLGVSTKEMRDLALATTNVTFPLKEVTASFDLLSRAGIKNTEVIKKTATAFDTLGDATGYGASQVTEIMIPAMKTFGLSADEIADKIDMMTFMSKQSTMSLDDFATMVGYTTPQLVEQGLTIEDLTAALILMEREGYAPGRVMTREFMKATTLAQKEQISITEALGYTTEEVAALIGEMEGAVGITQKYADVANEQYGIMSKLKQKWEEITLSLGSYLTPFEPIFALMTAMGPVMMFLSTQIGINTVKWIANTAAVVANKIALAGWNITASVTNWFASTSAVMASTAALTAFRGGTIGAIAGLKGLGGGAAAAAGPWGALAAAIAVGSKYLTEFIINTQLTKREIPKMEASFWGLIVTLPKLFFHLRELNVITEEHIKNLTGWQKRLWSIYEMMAKILGFQKKEVEESLGDIKEASTETSEVMISDWESLASEFEAYNRIVEESTIRTVQNIRDAFDGYTESVKEATEATLDMRTETQKLQEVSAPTGLPAGVAERIGVGATLTGREAWIRAMGLSATMEMQALAQIPGYLAMLEKGTAWAQVTPQRLGGVLPDIQVHVDMNVDGTKLAEAVGEPLVDSIRLKTGVRSG